MCQNVAVDHGITCNVLFACGTSQCKRRHDRSCSQRHVISCPHPTFPELINPRFFLELPCLRLVTWRRASRCLAMGSMGSWSPPGRLLACLLGISSVTQGACSAQEVVSEGQYGYRNRQRRKVGCHRATCCCGWVGAVGGRVAASCSLRRPVACPLSFMASSLASSHQPYRPLHGHGCTTEACRRCGVPGVRPVFAEVHPDPIVQPLSPERRVPGSMTALATAPNRLSNRFWGRFWSPFLSNASLPPPLRSPSPPPLYLNLLFAALQSVFLQSNYSQPE